MNTLKQVSSVTYAFPSVGVTHISATFRITPANEDGTPILDENGHPLFHKSVTSDFDTMSDEDKALVNMIMGKQ